MSCTCKKNKKFIPGYSNPLCEQCRADLELGRLVRKMRHTERLERGSEQWSYEDEDGFVKFAKTPEAALKEVGR